MSTFWKVVIIIIVAMIAMVLITYFVPQVKAVGEELKISTKLPLWIVGLFAPIIFLFRKIGGAFSGLFGGGATEESIRAENEAIKVEREKLVEEVRKLDEWRNRELELQRAEITAFEKKISSLRTEAQAIDTQFQQIMATAPDKFAEHLSKEELLKRLSGETGIAVSGGRPID